MLNLEAEQTSKQNILIAETSWQYQAHSQVFRFGEKIHFYGGKILIFIICLKQIFLSKTKFGGHKKYLGVTDPNAPPCLPAWEKPSPESL